MTLCCKEQTDFDCRVDELIREQFVPELLPYFENSTAYLERPRMRLVRKIGSQNQSIGNTLVILQRNEKILFVHWCVYMYTCVYTCIHTHRVFTFFYTHRVFTFLCRHFMCRGDECQEMEILSKCVCVRV